MNIEEKLKRQSQNRSVLTCKQRKKTFNEL